MCGEKFYLSGSDGGCEGSPPRVRGKETANPAEQKEFGITPACAGKRRLRRHAQQAVRDHPACAGKRNSLFGEKGI